MPDDRTDTEQPIDEPVIDDTLPPGHPAGAAPSVSAGETLSGEDGGRVVLGSSGTDGLDRGRTDGPDENS